MLSGYLALFATAFIAATLFPLGSEAVLVGLIVKNYPVVILVLVATAGNVLGSMVNYALGFGAQSLLKRRGKLDSPILIKAQSMFQTYGVWTLLFAWLPVIGDPLTLVAGLARVRFWFFTLLVTLGKGRRYAAIAYTIH